MSKVQDIYAMLAKPVLGAQIIATLECPCCDSFGFCAERPDGERWEIWITESGKLAIHKHEEGHHAGHATN